MLALFMLFFVGITVIGGLYGSGGLVIGAVILAFVMFVLGGVATFNKNW